MSFDLETRFPTLEHAPITEAIIDIRAAVDPGVTLDDLALFQEGREQQFVERVERRSLQTRIEFNAAAETKVTAPAPTPDGYLFRSPGDKLIAQARLDGFTLSRLRPYHDGDTFLAQARQLWEQYVRVARPQKVTRAAIRNVNRIEMAPGSDIQRYVLTGPEIAHALPQSMIAFFMRVVMPDPSGAFAVITETLGEPDPEGKAIPLIFDVDAFQQIELEPSDPALWNVLAVLRALKNRVFFRSLTTEALEACR